MIVGRLRSLWLTYNEVDLGSRELQLRSKIGGPRAVRILAVW